MASDPAEEDRASYIHKDPVQHNPILWAQTTEARRMARVAMALLHQPTPSQTSAGCCSEGAQGGTEHVSTMEVNGTNYLQPDAFISDHPLVTAFLRGQGRTMNYRDAFNTVKQAKAFCRDHFNSLDHQAVYHPWEHHCATAAWGGRAKGLHVCIIKALPNLYQAQSKMHAQLAQDVPLNQIKVVNNSLAIAPRQGTDTQARAPEERADTIGVEKLGTSYCLPTTYVRCEHSRSSQLRSSLPCYLESVYSVTRVQVDLCSYGTQLKPSSNDMSV
jgi:hypothetical protein